jgi:ribosome-associated translation inhibitor RaiA
MNFIDLPIQFQVEVDEEQLSSQLQEEAERRLSDLIEAHNDLIGGEVSITALEGNTDQAHNFQVRVVLDAWPSDLVVVKKAGTLQVALRRALDAIEHQVRQVHKNHQGHWKRREINDRRADDPEDMGIYVGAIYDARVVEEMFAEG